MGEITPILKESMGRSDDFNSLFSKRVLIPCYCKHSLNSEIRHPRPNHLKVLPG